MSNEDINGAINYLKSYRKLDEKTHNMSPKDSVSYFATDKCLKYWDMAIKALKQYGALQEIRQEIEQEQSEWIKGSDPEWHAFDKAIAIINKHIKEYTNE